MQRRSASSAAPVPRSPPGAPATRSPRPLMPVACLHTRHSQGAKARFRRHVRLRYLQLTRHNLFLNRKRDIISHNYMHNYMQVLCSVRPACYIYIHRVQDSKSKGFWLGLTVKSLPSGSMMRFFEMSSTSEASKLNLADEKLLVLAVSMPNPMRFKLWCPGFLRFSLVFHSFKAQSQRLVVGQLHQRLPRLGDFEATVLQRFRQPPHLISCRHHVKHTLLECTVQSLHHQTPARHGPQTYQYFRRPAQIKEQPLKSMMGQSTCGPICHCVGES